MKESEGEEEGDCVMCTIMKGVCKKEFVAFDTCVPVLICLGNLKSLTVLVLVVSDAMTDL